MKYLHFKLNTMHRPLRAICIFLTIGLVCTATKASLTLTYRGDPIQALQGDSGISVGETVNGKLVFKLKPSHVNCENCWLTEADLEVGTLVIGKNVFNLPTRSLQMTFNYSGGAEFKLTSWTIRATTEVQAKSRVRGELMLNASAGNTDGVKYGQLKLFYSENHNIPSAYATTSSGSWSVSFDRAAIAELQRVRNAPRHSEVDSERSATLALSSMDALQRKLAEIATSINEQARSLNVAGITAERLLNGNAGPVQASQTLIPSRDGPPGRSEKPISEATPRTQQLSRVASTTVPNAVNAHVQVPSQKQDLSSTLDNRLKRERMLGRLEAKLGVKATEIYFRLSDGAAGGDKIVGIEEAAEFVSQSLDFHLALRAFEYDSRFPRGENTPVPQGLFGVRSVTPRPQFLDQWRQRYCIKGELLGDTRELLQTLEFSATEDTLVKGVEFACRDIIRAFAPKPPTGPN